MVQTEVALAKKIDLQRIFQQFAETIPGFGERSWSVGDIKKVAARFNATLYQDQITSHGYSLKIEKLYVIAYNAELPKPIQDLVVAHEFAHILLGHTDNTEPHHYTSAAYLDQEIAAQAMAFEFWMPRRILDLHETITQASISYDDTRILIELSHGKDPSPEYQLEILRRFSIHTTRQIDSKILSIKKRCEL